MYVQPPVTFKSRPTRLQISFATPAAQTSFDARLYHDLLEAKAGVRESDLALVGISVHMVDETREIIDASVSLEHGIPLPRNMFEDPNN